MLGKFPNNPIINQLKHNSHKDQFLSVYNWMPLEQKWDLFSDEVTDQIINDERTLGIIDDIFQSTNDINPYDRVLHFFEKKASEIMTKKPTVANKSTLVGQALNIMNRKKITSLFICEKKIPIGIVHIHDLLRLTS